MKNPIESLNYILKIPFHVVDKEQLEQVNIDELKLRVNKKDINAFLLETSWHARFEYMGKISKNKKIGRLYDHE